MYKILLTSLVLLVLNVLLCDCQVKKPDSCPKLFLQNGRIRYKQRGKLAKFQCNPGYYLIGERYIMCAKREWDGKVPVCAKPGCKRVKAPQNCIIGVTHRGANLNFFSLPGYVVRGPPSTYCDGYRWVQNLPTCLKTGNEPATTCDFESEDLCGWTQDLNHEFDWRRHNFFTPSGHRDTGPQHDHTKGMGQDGYYMYIESSSRILNDTARLISPVYNKMENGLCFTFYYHMYGIDIGQLRVYIKNETDLTHIKYTKPMFWLTGNQGNVWRKGIIRLDSMLENFQIIIEGVRGVTYISDIAIDDVSLTETCPEEDILTSSTTMDYTSVTYPSFESCLERCGNPPDNADINSPLCDCDDGCIDRNTCCLDYISVCLLEEVSDMTEVNEDIWTTSTSITTAQEIDQTTEIHVTKKQIKYEPTEPNIIESTQSKIYPFETTSTTTNPIQPTKIVGTTSLKPNTTATETTILQIMKETIQPISSVTNPLIEIITKTAKPMKNETKPIETPKSGVKPIKPIINDVKTKQDILTSNITNNQSNTVFKKVLPPMKVNKTIIYTNDINKMTKKPFISITKKPIPKLTTKIIVQTTPQHTTPSLDDFTEDDVQETPSIMTDYDETSEEVIDNHEPKLQMLSEIERINKINRNTSTNMILGIICSLIFVTLIAISAIFVVRKYKLCSKIKFRHSNNSDSLSDVRFLASDEILDFSVRYAD